MMNPIADQALVTLVVSAAILALVTRRIAQPRSAVKRGATHCAGACGCARQTPSLARILADNQADANLKLAKPNRLNSSNRPQI